MKARVCIVFGLLVLNCFANPTVKISCEFDGDFCDYVSDGLSDAWAFHNVTSQRTSAITDGPLYGPPIKTDTNFLIINSSRGSLQSPLVHMKGFYCLSLDFYLYGSEGHLFVYAQRFHDNQELPPINKQDFPLFARNTASSYVDRWQHFEKTVHFLDGNFIICIDSATDADERSVALSNLKFVGGTCHDRTPDTKTCDFDGIIGGADETGLGCDWIKPILTTKMPWGRLNDRWRLEFPNAKYHEQDHSTQSEFGGQLSGVKYENSGPHELVLDEIKPEDGEHCFSFWVHHSVNGIKYDIVETNANRSYEKVLYASTDADVMRSWSRRAVNIDPKFPLTVKLRYLRGSHLKLDSLKLRKGKCEKRAHCEFEDGFCGFGRDAYTQLHHSARIGTGRLQTYQPKQFVGSSHTLDNQNSMYFDLSKGNPLKNHLYSEVIDKKGTYCIIIGSTTTQLSIAKHSEDVNHFPGTKLSINKWVTDGNWITFHVDVDIIEPTRFVFTFDEREAPVVKVRKITVNEGKCRDVSEAGHHTETNKINFFMLSFIAMMQKLFHFF